MTTLRNSVYLIGRLGNDPELKTVGNDRRLARFSIATNDYYYDKKGDRIEQTIWHNVVAWGKTAEAAEKILSKGKEVALQGKLITRVWEDNENKKHYITEVVANELMVFGNGNQK
ncbi:single-stranded DNA-binding protein [Candidatus Sulfidibacterium hydrothermale]|uniref:single-stranded DNA-binding protein n=1 Tax=Candidatus Sulfidibacterium hydrothermale TaxID=2875962 RepID=UPI001F0B03D7|nr:single-stranded DNA-binding protein [Candidatus Sulfidibacterium hydrothermale]UBM62801.1 single-stranded DNA-binding protein [Candidatus Sulfidibacterium hydrothermale]